MVRYVLVSGGVMSGLGKGIVCSSTGMLLCSFGFSITSIKIDPYLNIDAGTMSPFEHGEVFILDDGGEADLDLGNYERFMSLTLTKDNNITTGKIYSEVIQKERRGDYLGKTVQVIPHVCNEIQDWIQRVSIIPTNGTDNEPEICMIELGGTIGDMESMPFVEAMRQFQFRVGKENICFIHVSLIPVIGVVGEQKSKPTQQSVKELRALGISPDIIICRSTSPLEDDIKKKISNFCHVKEENVFSCHDVSNIWQVPLLLLKQGLPSKIFEVFKINPKVETPNLKEWRLMAMEVDVLQKQESGIRIAMVGKYTGLTDSYLSVIKGLQHSSRYIGKKLFIEWIDASDLEDEKKSEKQYGEAWKTLKSVDGILVPGGFGDRGIEGKILAAKYARENNIPFFGICLGLQIAVIEYARNVLGIKNAHSEECQPDVEHKVVVFMPEVSKTQLGGTMRLGVRETHIIDNNSTAAFLYKKIWNCEGLIPERHRHRYEVNPEYVERLSKAGLNFVGKDETGKRQEIIELPGHPFFLGVQYHPEMKSRPTLPSPPFVGLMFAASKQLESWKKGTWVRPDFEQNQ